MFCKNCGHNLADGARFCTECGTVVTDEARNIYDKSVREEPSYPSSPVSDSPAEYSTESGQNICSVCKTPNAEGLKFCVNCGLPIGESKEKTNFDVNMQSKQTKSKAPLIIIIVAVAVVLLGAVAALFIFDPFDFGLGKDDSSKTTVETTYDNGYDWQENNGFENGFNEVTRNFTYLEPKTEPVEIGPVNDNTGVIDKSQMQSLQSKIAKKESATGVTIKFTIKDDLNLNAESFANRECINECGDDGIYIVIDTKRNEAAIATSGDGEKYVGASAKRMVDEGIEEHIEYAEYYDACVKVLDNILNKEKSTRFEEVAGADQVVFVEKNSGSNTGKLYLVEWYRGDEEILYEIDKVYLGKDGITSSPSETKSATPKGTFKLGFAFSDKRLDTKLDSKVIKSGDVWVDDSDSRYYNTLQHGSTSNSKWDSAENTYYAFSSGIFEACILIEHNGDGYTKGERGKGSCIYVSGKNKDLSTSYGDVNVSASQMADLLLLLDEAKNPHIVIR